MWIELKGDDKILVNLDELFSLEVEQIGRFYFVVFNNKYGACQSERHETLKQTQARYEEIKGMLVNNSIANKLDTIIENQNYWGREIEGNTRNGWQR